MRQEIDRYCLEVQKLQGEVRKEIAAAELKEGPPQGSSVVGTSGQEDHDADWEEFVPPQEQQLEGKESLPTNITTGSVAAADVYDFPMLRFIRRMGTHDSITKFTSRQVLQILLKCEAMFADARAKIATDTEWVIKSVDSGTPAKNLVDQMTAAFIYSVDAKDCHCQSLAECQAKQLNEGTAGGKKHRTAPLKPTNPKALG